MQNQSVSSINEISISDFNIKTGLTDAQVIESRNIYGDNLFTPPAKQPIWKLYLEKYNDPLIKILLVALCFSMAVSCYETFGNSFGIKTFLEPLGIAVAVILATTVGFILELSANRKFDVLNKLSDDTLVNVRRNGNITTVPRRDIVVGDIIILDTGEKIPADGFLLSSANLILNESSLTGEPQVAKSHDPANADANATYPSDMLLRSSNILEGNGSMVVTAVGDATEYGKVFKAVHIDANVETPLTRQLSRLGTLISYMSYTIGAIILIARTLIYDYPYLTLDFLQYSLTTVMLAVSLIVVSVPEGLPMSVSLSLALSMRRMLASNNLVRKMHACETMGATSVICTDKTGTLTQNQMKVHDVDFVNSSPQPTLDIANAIATNTTAHIDRSKDTPKPIGNPTEASLLLWLNSYGYNYESIRNQFTAVSQVPFSTERKFMATEVIHNDSMQRYLFIKGAPEIVMTLCKIPDEQHFSAKLAQYQKQAMRTLAFAYANIDGNANGIISGNISPGLDIRFMGIVAIADPLREDVPDAIAQCTQAGIKVIMVTGDTPGTAKEIAHEAGLISDDYPENSVISGPDFAALNDEDALQRAGELRIISRARPADKARLVSLLQKRGEVVAVTGDGTNDAPALNAAHVGLAMGSGTAVAKEAGDIVILDNSFAGISRAVMWGRSLYRNIQRFILFQLTVNVVACIIVAIGAFTSFQSPLTVTQMLWVNLIMDTFAALALASLPPSKSVLYDKPRKSSSFIINRKMAVFIIGTGILLSAILFGLLQYMHHFALPRLSEFSLKDFFNVYFDFNYDRHDIIDAYERTIFFTIFIALQFWNLFNAKVFMTAHSSLNIFHNFKHCAAFYATVAMILGGQILIVAFGGDMFSVVPITPIDFLLAFVVTTPVLLLSIPFINKRKSNI